MMAGVGGGRRCVCPVHGELLTFSPTACTMQLSRCHREGELEMSSTPPTLTTWALGACAEP